MALKGTRNLNAGARVAMVFAAAGLAGYAWRFFGEVGNGTAVLGLFAALFFFAFFGNRKAVTYESLPVAAALAAATAAPFYASGLLPHKLPLWGGLLIAFGLMPLLTLWIGTRLSKRGWKFWEVLVLTAGFFALAIPLRMFAAPHLLPAAVRGNAPLCRAAANAAAAVVVWAAAGVWKRDPIASLLPCGLSCTGVPAVLGASLIHRTSFAGNDVIVYLLTSMETAGFYAFFLLGLLGALVLVCLPGRVLEGEGKFKLRSPIPNRYGRWLFDAIFVLLLVAALPVYRLGSCILDLLHWSAFDPWIIVYGALTLAALIASLVMGGSNGILGTDRDRSHTAEVLLHIGEADFVARTTGQGVLNHHVLNACGTECCTHLGVVLDRDTLVVNEYAGSGVLHLLSQFCNGLLLLFEYSFAGHDFTSRL